MDISRLTRQNARYRPHHTALVFEDVRLDWASLDARIDRLARALRAHGVARGDRVAMVIPNCVELLAIYWACARIGAAAVPLSPLLMTAGIESLLRDAEPAVVFAARATAAAVAEATGRLSLSAARVTVDGAAADGFATLADFMAAADAFTVDPAVDVLPDDVCNIMYTSGTTGMPKGIVHTHRVRALYGALFAGSFRITPDSVVLHTGALIFNGAFVTMVPCFAQGATYVLHRQFDAAALIETVAREKVTHTMMVPSQIIAMLNAPDFDPAKLASLEVLLSLGAPLPVAQKDALEAALPGRFHELYGLTEGLITILDRRDALARRGSVGIPPPYFTLRIVGENGREAAPGEVGEITGRSPVAMTGYYNRPDLTADALRDGWIHSGDLGYVDDDGYLFLVDRKKDMIDSGGVKVYPRDIEEVIATHPSVLEAAVFGIPDQKWGETPVAALTLKAGAREDADQMREWINARVGARYQRLARVLVMDALPKNAAGKILKRALREPFWEGRSVQI